MEEYAGRVLGGRYRLPRPRADEFELVETRAYDTYSEQEVLVRQLLLPEIVQAEVVGAEPATGGGGDGGDPARRALEAARAAAAIPDHPRLVQVFDVLVENGSLWVVSELVPARPVAALIAEEHLSPYRAAEVASDLLGGLGALHAHGWAHRNITAHTVLVCDDGRAMLDGLAFGAAQEALCGYDPVPAQVLTAPRREDGGRGDEGGGGDGADGDEARERAGWGGPDSALALERARQARMTVVGPVTERWAPEQAVAPVGGNWQLAPPVGPAADLWALGALLFRCVQGHPAFPEESAAELVALVCAEPPALAEECGPLRPVVESLLRQDPDERPEFEELRGWLRSLIRSAPEPGVGTRTLQVPSDHVDPRRLPEIRRKGELVRLRGRKASRAHVEHGRHARARRAPRGGPVAVPEREIPLVTRQSGHADAPARRGPRRLGLLLIALVLAALLAGLAYATLLMPHRRTGSGARPAPGTGTVSSSGAQDAPTPSDHSMAPGPTVPAGFALRKDPAGFTVAVPDGWTRSTGPDDETVYASNDATYRLVVADGRDTVASYGSDPLTYENQKEPELSDFRASSWASSSDVKNVQLTGAPAAEGTFTWRDPDSGEQLYARNLAVLNGGAYDVVLVIGPDDQQASVDADFTAAAGSFRPGSS
ncbi:protein tyrosine kinase [Streptomyces sp. PTM05]|uniref:Protein tyrosine kinase n=1 Tax=Streptantibioticus parmotrematis TaxID=2873249 RepID=A0ABS7QLP9_9ACTN|nr:protein tyrosine kinase [Streptantibioticus parmotrematis]MBY8883863.1 protein tyrosine kinase [Streptantibioticus parmotrematis]